MCLSNHINIYQPCFRSAAKQSHFCVELSNHLNVNAPSHKVLPTKAEALRRGDFPIETPMKRSWISQLATFDRRKQKTFQIANLFSNPASGPAKKLVQLNWNTIANLSGSVPRLSRWWNSKKTPNLAVCPIHSRRLILCIFTSNFECSKNSH